MDAFTRMETAVKSDFEKVAELAAQLIQVLHDTRKETNKLLAAADTLNKEDEDNDDLTDPENPPEDQNISTPIDREEFSSGPSTPSSTSSRKTENGLDLFNDTDSDEAQKRKRPSSSSVSRDQGKGAGRKNSRTWVLLARENAMWKAKVEAQRAKNRVLCRVLPVSMYGLEHCVRGFHTIVSAKEQENIDVHRVWTRTIHDLEHSNAKKRIGNVELGVKYFHLSRTYRNALRVSTASHIDKSDLLGKPLETKDSNGNYDDVDDRIDKKDEGNNEKEKTDEGIGEKETSPLDKTKMVFNKEKDSFPLLSNFLDPSSLSGSHKRARNENKMFNTKYQTYLPESSLSNYSNIRAGPREGESWFQAESDVTKMPDYVKGMLEAMEVSLKDLVEPEKLLYRDIKDAQLDTDNEFEPSGGFSYSLNY